MKKHFLILATLLLCAFSVQAQNRYSGDLFSIAAPQSGQWQALDVDMEGGGQGITLFTADGDIVTAGIVVTVIPQKVDLDIFIQAQIDSDNPVCKDGEFTEVEDDEFMGYKAKLTEFNSHFDGQKYKGGVAVFHTNSGTAVVFLYSNQTNPDFISVLKTLEFH